MSRNTLAHSLSTLVDLREREVDRLSADLAHKEVVRERFRTNLNRLHSLTAGQAPVGAQSMALSLNRAGYKQALLQMADQHRQDLALHEADMAVTRQALGNASRKREVLGQVLSQELQQQHRAAERQEQKRQDDVAAQVWWRGRT